MTTICGMGSPRHLLPVGFVLAAVAFAATACRDYSIGFGRAADGTGTHASAAATPLRLLTGPSTGAYLPLGRALADAYNSRLSTVRVTAAMTEGPEGAGANAKALDAGAADLGFSRADIAYQEYRQPTNGSASHLRSIAVIYINAVHLVVRRASGITRGEEIRGHRVQMSEENNTSGGALARFVIEGYGLTEHDVQAVGSPRNAIARLKSGQFDVRIFASAYPLDSIDDVGPSSSIALLSIDPAVIDRLRSRFPFFKPTVIPKGSYKGQTEDIQTVGIDGLLLCRDSMPESMVYDLTKTLFDALPALAKTHNSARMIDVVNAPATPIPLHPGAARYYRERDLFR